MQYITLYKTTVHLRKLLLDPDLIQYRFNRDKQPGILADIYDGDIRIPEAFQFFNILTMSLLP